MSSIITIAGIDPSLRNFGLVKGLLNINSGDFDIKELSLIETKIDKKNKKVVRKNSEDLERATQLYVGMHDFLSDVDLISVEIPVGSQTARAMASYGVCIGVLSSIKIPMIQVTPAEVKIAATGKKTASKQDMINWAVESYPEASWFKHTVKGVTSFTAKNEHLADALAAIYAGVRTEQFNQLKLVFNLRK